MADNEGGAAVKQFTTLCLAAAVFAASALASACGPVRRDEPHTEALTQPAQDVAAGERLFAYHCYQCHPGGAAGLGPPLNDKPLPVTAIKLQVRKGLGAMPAFNQQQLSDQELGEVVRYLKALRTLEPVARAR
jgi:mono/diheme cytochrome c family protein